MTQKIKITKEEMKKKLIADIQEVSDCNDEDAVECFWLDVNSILDYMTDYEVKQ